ncbi:AmmeMemoRadiSam system protein B [Actinomyces provencensis]|uniref:AmmeMemoRadiSam system protein B n=1 Tax=Actinomyces provencensis TaxID=1720198 RepID=UPI00096A60BC|nr:AmmeMemoRadiSam system protein B [Actinomyces provencensis]
MTDQVHTVRPPAVAGFFYPADPTEVAEEADRLLARASAQLVASEHNWTPKALVVPHAGWEWSGDLAALGWQTLAPRRRTITRVVLLGPTHRVGIRGIALPGSDFFRTPLGDLPIPTHEVLAATSDLPRPVTVDSLTHAEEHAIEVQVPFIQRVLGTVNLVPLNVGMATPTEVADVIEALWGERSTVVAVSSDLSHYHDAATARALDAATIEQVLTLSGPVAHDRACGASPLNGLLEVCRRRGLSPHLLGAHNSGDVPGGGGDHVVGYAAFAIEEEHHDTPSST